MPTTCRSCCCSVRSGQQVLMCCVCCDLVHLRCLPVSYEEANVLASQSQWECVLCLAKKSQEEEEQLIRYAREQWMNERLDDLVGQVMALQQEQDNVGHYLSECSSALRDQSRQMDELEKTVEDLHELSKKNSSSCWTEDIQPDPPTPIGRRRSLDSLKPKQRKMTLHNLGTSSRTDSHKTHSMPKMSMSLGVLISQLIIMECS
uniref:DNA mismatch repair protein MutS n=1 Tax=Lygus hesperus TaxID=30085 RepID=A0A0A9Z7F1_LYGHE